MQKNKRIHNYPNRNDNKGNRVNSVDINLVIPESDQHSDGTRASSRNWRWYRSSKLRR